MSEDPPHPMLNDPKGFCKYSISHISKSLKVYESCILSKKQEQLNCKEVYSIIQMRTFYAEKWDHAVQYQFSGLTE